MRSESAPKTPYNCVSVLWKRIPGYIRMTFASAVVLGFVTHLYMFTNKLTNHDDMLYLFIADYGTASGRWLLPSVLGLDGNFSMPWLIGLLSILCLAGVACLTVSLLRIRHPLGCIVAAGIIVSFPSVTATLTYMFTADGYFFGLLLAALCAYLSVRHGWWGSLFGAVSLTLSMGIYQSYFPVAAVLMVGALLFETLDGELSFKQLLLKGLRLVLTLAVALVAYMVIVRISTRNVALVDYMGISDMGKLSLAEIPSLISQGFEEYFRFYMTDSVGCHFGFLKYAFAAVALLSAALLVLMLWKRKLGSLRSILAIALAAVYPLAGSLIYVMVPQAEIHALMLFGYAYILILPVALVDYMELSFKQLPLRTFRTASAWVIILTIALTGYSYTLFANSAYLKIDLSMRQCTAYSTRLLERVESCDGYQQGMDLVLVGSQARDDALNATPQLDDINLTGVFDMPAFRGTYTYGNFLRYYLGFPSQVFTGKSDIAKDLAANETVQAMPVYPQTGSIQVIDNMIVVKFSDE